MDKRIILKNIIKNNISLSGGGKEFYYPNISDRVKTKIMNNFDRDMYPDNVVAYIDTSIFRTYNEGPVFTLTGFYDRGMWSKPYYFNYSDIVSIEGTSLDEMILDIKVKDGWVYNMSNGINLHNLKNVLLELKDTAMQWNDIVSVRPSGEIDLVSQFFDQLGNDRLKGMRQGYLIASSEYEEKLRKQADDFLKQRRDFHKERDGYERLLDEYETYIHKLETQLYGRSTANLNSMKNQCNALKALKYS